jgi:hypothetical protein
VISCTDSLDSSQEVLEYVNKSNNGLKKQRKIDDLIFTVKYLPPEYLILKENEALEADRKEQEEYLNGITFSLTISSEGDFGKVLYRGITDEEQLKSRISFLNFQFGSLLELNNNNVSITPTLSLLENTYNLTDNLNFLIVFEKDKLGEISNQLDLKYIDWIFDTGIHHFLFEQKDIDKIPKINL